MHRKLALLAAFIIAFAGFGIKAQAHDKKQNEKICSFYAKTGSAVAEALLPMTFQDILKAISGEDEKGMAKIVEAIQDKVNLGEVAAISRLDKEDLGLLSGSAGQVAVELLLSYQVTSASELEDTMERSCQKVGYMNIIENQRQSDQSEQKNLAK